MFIVFTSCFVALLPTDKSYSSLVVNDVSEGFVPPHSFVLYLFHIHRLQEANPGFLLLLGRMQRGVRR